MRAFDHVTVRSVAEALQALSASGDSAKVIAGGAELLSLMKSDLVAPKQVIDLKPTHALRRITLDADGIDGVVRIGALTTLSDIERSEALAERLPILRASVRDAATPQIRNVATVGGNLMQRNRCWYFRGPYTCWQKGGDQCFARSGQNKYHAIFHESPCVAVYPSDLAPALVALDASVEIAGPSRTHTMPLTDLLQPPTEERRRETTLAPDELITGVLIPAQPAGARGAYLKMMDRHAWAYALVSAAAQISIQDGVVQRVRIVLGGVANVPYRSADAETLLAGHPLTADTAAAAADAAIAGATPLAHNEYKVPMAREFVRRAILQAGGMDW